MWRDIKLFFMTYETKQKALENIISGCMLSAVICIGINAQQHNWSWTIAIEDFKMHTTVLVAVIFFLILLSIDFCKYKRLHR